MIESVSVVITTYNSSNDITKALQSVQDQVDVQTEILVVDDHSKDFELLSKIITTSFNHLDISIKQGAIKGNANVSRNIGICAAKYDYVAFLDADDTWNPKHLNKCITKIQQTDLPLCFSQVQFSNGNEVIQHSFVEFNGDVAKYIFNNGVAVTSSIVVKRLDALEVMFDEEQDKHQDWEFLIRFNKNKRICQSDYIGLNYTLGSSNNMSSSFNPLASIRFMNNTLPNCFHRVFFNSQFEIMLKKDNEKLFDLLREFNKEYMHNKNNIGIINLLNLKLLSVFNSRFGVTLIKIIRLKFKLPGRIYSKLQ
jgi:glycosyltransferase involved in cell wall biosynthesis